MTNQFQQAARAKKVKALVAYFDEFLAQVRLDPYADAAQLATTLAAMKPEVWKHHAIYAGQRPPSETATDREQAKCERVAS